MKGHKDGDMSKTATTANQNVMPTAAEIKRRTLKPVNAWWNVLVTEPISVRMVWILVRLSPRVTPNMVTTSSLLAGLASASAFTVGRPILGAVLYQFSFLLDCTDGKLARLTSKSSRLGGFWDGLVNNVVFAAVLLGLMFGSNADKLMHVIGALLLASWALHLALVQDLSPAVRGHWVRIAPDEKSWLRRHRLIYPMSFPDKHALLFFVAPFFGLVLHVSVLILVVELIQLAAKVTVVMRASRTMQSESAAVPV